MSLFSPLTTTHLTRIAALSAIGAGALFIGVQINHPPVDLTLVTTTEWTVRQSVKVLMAVLSLVGITGLFLRHPGRNGLLGLLGYGLFAGGYLAMLTLEIVGLVVLPAIAGTSPAYVSDVLAVATGGRAAGDIGLLQTLNALAGIGYLGGGLVFGIALFRAHVVNRWASALLAASTLLTAAIPLLPQVNQRLFAIPAGVAFIALGSSLFRSEQSEPVQSEPARPSTTTATPPLTTAGTR